MRYQNRFFAAALTLALSLLAAGNARAAVFIVPTDDELIQDADAIVVATVDSGYGAFALNGDIVTHTRLDVVSVLKGALQTGPLEVRDLGGEVGSQVMGVSGGVTYLPGERVVVFLQREPDGAWTTWGMILGKFEERATADGQQILVRGLSEGILGLRDDGTDHVEIPRDSFGFIGYIRRVVNDEMPPPKLKPVRDGGNYFRPGVKLEPKDERNRFEIVATSHYPPSAYTQGTFRWARFDAGQSATYRSSGTQPGYDAVGASQRALAAWTNDPASNVLLTYGGTSTAGFVQDGQNTMVYNSSTDVPSGAIGYSKWYGNSSHTYKGQTFYSISEGDTVMRAGLSVSNAVFEEAVTHEVGHTLGFRHSDQGTPSSNDAVMRSAVTGRYGASLGPWDMEAVNHVYGDGNGGQPPTCTAPAITANPASTTINAGQSVTLTVGATGTGPLTYQWYVGASGNTSSPTGSNSPSITVAPTTTTSYWVRVSNACGAVNSATATITVAPSGRIRGDFNGDGYADFIWRNRRTGENRIWLMRAETVLNSIALPSVPDLNWRIVGAGDFNADGMQDLFWHNRAGGQTVVWYMSNTTNTGSANLTTVSDLSWRPESVNDWNHDGHADVVWRNYSNGQNVIWFMNRTTITSSTSIPGATDTNWHIVGTGDTNADGHEDIVWRNFANGQNLIFQMRDLTIVATPFLQTVADQAWQVGAVAMFNGDTWGDIAWRNYSTGENATWYSANPGATRYPPAERNIDWELSGPR